MTGVLFLGRNVLLITQAYLVMFQMLVLIHILTYLESKLWTYPKNTLQSTEYNAAATKAWWTLYHQELYVVKLHNTDKRERKAPDNHKACL